MSRKSPSLIRPVMSEVFATIPNFSSTVAEYTKKKHCQVFFRMLIVFFLTNYTLLFISLPK